MSGRGAERILQLVGWMADQAHPVSFAEAVKALDLPKSSTLGLLRLLVDTGHAQRLPDGRYKIVHLPGEPTPERGGWGTVLRHAELPLRSAVQETQESGFIAVLEADLGVRYISKVLPKREILYDRDITIARRAHQVSSGIVLLTQLEDDRLRAYAEAERAAGRLEESPDDLMTKVRSARAQGLFVNPLGVVEGAGGMAAPIRARDGRIIAAVNIAAPSVRLAQSIPDIMPKLIECAERISAALGWTGSLDTEKTAASGD